MQIGEARPTCTYLLLYAVSAFIPTFGHVTYFNGTTQTLLYQPLPSIICYFQAFALIYILNFSHVVATATNLLCAILVDVYFVTIKGT